MSADDIAYRGDLPMDNDGERLAVAILDLRAARRLPSTVGGYATADDAELAEAYLSERGLTTLTGECETPDGTRYAVLCKINGVWVQVIG